MLFTTAQEDFVTRLTVNNIKLDQGHGRKILGFWVSQDLSSAYSRVSMLTKLKYVGVSMEDVIDIFELFTRST